MPALVPVLLACLGTACQLARDPSHPAGASAGPRIDYRLSYDPSAGDPVWRVELNASGLQGAEGLALELENWGEWLRLDDYYLRRLVSEPPLRRREQRNVVEVVTPAGWDGELRVSYELPLVELGSDARESFGLLPYRAPSYAFGFAANTLFQVTWNDRPEAVERTLELLAPPDWTIASGFGAPALGRLQTRLPPHVGNMVISMGIPVAVASVTGVVPIEVVQWGGSAPVAERLHDFARVYLASCTRSLGVPPADPVRLIVTEPGHGGTRVDGAIAVGCPGGADGAWSPYTLHFLAHELFHDWLGGRLRSAEEGESMCWFWEGFTEYLSLWHLAQTGLVSREWFAARLFDYEEELRSNEHWGRVAFADPEVAWRDPAVEPLAYKGSALLAFALDAELWRAGKGGVAALPRALLERDGGRYTRTSIQRWLGEQDLEAFWRDHFAAPRREAPRPDLLALGYEERSEPRLLAYVGLRLDRDGPFGTVVAVDSSGPSAGLVSVGDRVSGLTPTREPIEGAESAAPDFPFGLAYYEPEAEVVRVDLERGSDHHQVWVRPRQLDGPPRSVLVPGPELDNFFR